MSRKTSQLTDLFGDPWTPPRDPRGRKSHKRAKETAEKVAVLRASGHTVEDIALRMGLSEPTLRKYYFRELDHGRALAEAVLDEALWARAMDGNVSAMKELKAQFAKGRATAVSNPLKTPTSERLGKKAERLAAAAQVGGIFAQGEPPQRH